MKTLQNLKDPHVEFLRGIENPIGIKVGHTTDPNELINVIERINPYNIHTILICYVWK